MTAGLDAAVVVHRSGFTLDVSLTVAPGDVLAVLGPNGAGKSTVLDVLAGLLRPDSGHVRVGGRTLTAADVHVPPHRRGVGLLAQQPLLFPHLSALANVAFGPRAQGLPRRTAVARARELLDAVDVGALAERRPGQLSGGQQQRVALARALAAGPDLLLLDEPLAALDVDTTPAMRALLRRTIRDSGRTAVLVTHAALDALVLADRVAVLSDGVVVEEGPTREVLARPRSPFAARIAGLDLVPGTACPEGLRTADGLVVAGHAEGTVVGDPAVAVFHPPRSRCSRRGRTAARATPCRSGSRRSNRTATSCGCAPGCATAARHGPRGWPRTSLPRHSSTCLPSPAPSCGSW